MDSEFGIGCKLLHLECIENKGLLYNTGNYIQISRINQNEKECIYVCVCVYKLYIYIQLSQVAVQQKLIQHCKSTILQ